MINSKKLSHNTKVVSKILITPKSSPLKVWSRSLKVIDKLIGRRLRLYNGKEFIPLLILPEMLGHKLGEFVPTRARYEFKKKKKKK